MAAPVIAVDARYGLMAMRRGIGEYVYRVLRELADWPRPYQLHLYADRRADPALVREFSVAYPVSVLPATNFFWWEQRLWPQAAQADGARLLHGTANIAPLRWRGGLLLTVHDVIEWHRGKDFPGAIRPRHRLSRLYRMNALARLAPRALQVLTGSQAAAADIARVLAVAAERLRVAPLAGKWRPEAAWSEQEPPYLLALGAVDPRKNTAALLAALGRCPPDIRLRVVGVEPSGLAHWRGRVQAGGLGDRVQVDGMVTDEVLRALVRGARAFVYPSLWEGFGLPVLEAMSQGCPVVAAGRGAVAEVGGAAMLAVDPGDEAALAQAIRRIWHDRGLRRQLSAAGLARAALFSWERTAAATDEAYRIALKEAGA